MEKLITSGKKVLAIIIRDGSSSEGLHFITPEKNPFQVATHNYIKTRETNIHKPYLRKPLKINEFHKFIYVTKGYVLVYLMDKKGGLIAKKRLIAGDGIIIMNTTHKVVFGKKSNAIEIKQGPYEPDT